jgi:translation initiation factor 1
MVTLVTGLPLDQAALEAMLKELKAVCGAGGTVREQMLEIQGDHRDRLAALLEQRGYRVKLRGG